MSCQQYSLRLSRYLDNDLEGKELEDLLEHLSGCKECYQELDAYEQLRELFQEADGEHGFPEPTREWRTVLLQDLEPVQKDLAGEGEPLGKRAAIRNDTEAREPRSSFPAWLGRLFSSPPARGFLRYALPLIILSVAATWWVQNASDQGIDVNELVPAENFAMAFQDDDAYPEDLYVMQHTAHQPGIRTGDELPMIQNVAGLSR